MLIAGAGPAAVKRTKRARELVRCSFCDKDQNHVRKIIEGPSVFICDECIEVCNDIIADDNKFTEPPRKDPDRRVRRELQKLYDRASAATVKRKSFADAEAIHAWLDTPDCVYKVTGEQWRTWEEMRPVVEAELLAPCQSSSSRIETIERNGGQAITRTVVRRTATVLDRAGQFGPAGQTWTTWTTATSRDVWTRTPVGWRRKSHETLDANSALAFMGTMPGRPLRETV